MTKFILYTNLFDLYGCLLTPKQTNIFESYYFENLSLSEIAHNLKISKQAVKDTLNKTELILENYEMKIALLSKTQNYKKIINDILNLVEKLEFDTYNDKNGNISKKIIVALKRFHEVI